MLHCLLNEILAFRDARNWGKHHTPENLAKSICIEAAELLECYQWNDSKFDPSNAEEEAADIMIYLLLFCHETGINLEEAVLSKLRKNARKYPVENNT
jgi:NTP pyrophosphatase (non-canonical NTP hydrolase)